MRLLCVNIQLHTLRLYLRIPPCTIKSHQAFEDDRVDEIVLSSDKYLFPQIKNGRKVKEDGKLMDIRGDASAEECFVWQKTLTHSTCK